MASDVNICNLAMAHLGADANISAIAPPDGSVEAERCAQFYPIARTMMLEAHPWSFAVKRRSLALLTDPPDAWAYRYALPSDCVKPWAVLPYQSNDDANSVDYILEINDTGTRTLLTNEENAVLRYTANVTDTTKYTNLFIDAFARLLAHFLAGPTLKGKTGREEAKAQLQLFQYSLNAAMASDGNSQKKHASYTPQGIAAR